MVCRTLSNHFQSPGLLSESHVKLARACDPNTCEMKAGPPEVQSHPQLYKLLQASYVCWSRVVQGSRMKTFISLVYTIQSESPNSGCLRPERARSAAAQFTVRICQQLSWQGRPWGSLRSYRNRMDSTSSFSLS